MADITSETMVLDVLDQRPKSIEVFRKYGMGQIEDPSIRSMAARVAALGFKNSTPTPGCSIPTSGLRQATRAIASIGGAPSGVWMRSRSRRPGPGGSALAMNIPPLERLPQSSWHSRK